MPTIVWLNRIAPASMRLEFFQSTSLPRLARVRRVLMVGMVYWFVYIRKTD